MIILEGPDLAGKSTLAQMLFDKLTRGPDSSRHPMVSHFTKVLPHFDKYWGYRARISRNVIQDRFHMSHVVYRHVGGESHELTPMRYELVDAEISRVGGIVVVLAPSQRLIATRFDALQRPEMYDRDYVLRVADEFNNVAAHNGRYQTKYGYYKMKVDIVIGDDDINTGVDTIGADTLVNRIAKLWLERQMELDRIIDDRYHRGTNTLD